MADHILILYGSYRSDRQGIRLADYLVTALAARGARPELVDAWAVGLPMLDRVYKEHPAGTAPAALEALAGRIRTADAFVFVAGEYNWSVQPGLKNLTDHFLEEWFWRPAAIASYSAGRSAGVRAGLAWHGILSEMGLVVVSSTLAVGGIGDALDPEGRPFGEGGAALERAFPRFADDLAWWTEAARRQRAGAAPPYCAAPSLAPISRFRPTFLSHPARGRRRASVAATETTLGLWASSRNVIGWRTRPLFTQARMACRPTRPNAGFRA